MITITVFNGEPDSRNLPAVPHRIVCQVEKGLDPVLLTQLTTFADDLVEFPEETAS